METQRLACLYAPFSSTVAIVAVIDYPDHLLTYQTGEEKLSYAGALISRVRPYLFRYFERIKPEINTHISQDDLFKFLSNLSDAWQKHNEAAKLINLFLCYQCRSKLKDWSVEEWVLARDLYDLALRVDHRKNIFSGGLKDKLEQESRRIAEEFRLSREDHMLLLTPSGGTFHETYFLSHGEFYLSESSGLDCAAHKKYLIEKYHCGDELIFRARLAKMDFDRYNKAELGSLLEECRERLLLLRIKKGYFLLGNDRFKAIDALLEFDNLKEYIWRYALLGLPDVLLRDEISRRLKLANRLQSDVDVMNLDPYQALRMVNEYILHRKRCYTIRLMPYYQTFSMSCGTACIMSLLGKVGVLLESSVEFNIWKQVGMPYNFPGGLAKILLQNGFSTRYYQFPAEPFTPDHKDIATVKSGDELMFRRLEKYLSLHKEAVEMGMEVTIKDWDSWDIMMNLHMGNPCIVCIDLGEETLHWILIRGYKGKRFQVIDPLGYIKTIDQQTLNVKSRTYMGKRMIVVEKFQQEFFTHIHMEMESLAR